MHDPIFLAGKSEAATKDDIRTANDLLRYQTVDMQVRIKKYSDRTAQIIQHEVDHCDGILI